jgi:hypothetical protein
MLNQEARSGVARVPRVEPTEQEARSGVARVPRVEPTEQESPKPKTLRDRLQDRDRVILTRGLNLGEGGQDRDRERYPAGTYYASDLPAIAYEKGFVIYSEPPIKEVTVVPTKDEQKLVPKDTNKKAKKDGNPS